ncbi:MAG: enoyl-CoA hydratase/isomerase family protein [Planctomycetota bacterium]|nr:enoyl-CoA hydratase/isomerase family protein [Planctomycetota bacterium]
MSSLASLEFATHRDTHVATLTLCREEARNAMSLDLLDALHAKVDEVAARADISVLVITGAGKAFCAGMDLKAVLEDNALALRLLMSLADLTVKIRTLPMVTVARVNGAAIGGGCGLTCVCDVAITHADAKLGFPEVDMGVCPAVVAPWLVRKVGAGRARRVLLMGGLMSGAEAHALGMVDHLAADLATLDATVDGVVKHLAAAGPHALKATKKLLNELDGSLDQSIVREGARLSAHVLSTPETQTALRAKMGK